MEDIIAMLGNYFPIIIGLIYLLIKIIAKNIIKFIVGFDLDAVDILALFTVDLAFLNCAVSITIDVTSILKYNPAMSIIYYILLVSALLLIILFYINFTIIRRRTTSVSMRKTKLTSCFLINWFLSMGFYWTIFKAYGESI